MSFYWQRACAWCGVASALTFFVGFWPFAHYVPAIPPTWGVEQVAENTLNNITGIRIFCILFMYAGVLLMPFYAVISYQMSRIEGRYGPLSGAQLLLGLFATIPFVYGPILWGVMTFRPDRDPELIYLLSDINWIATFFYGGAAVLQYIVIGIAILSDKRKEPIMPRWAGYFNIWCATLNIPTGFMMFFKEGAFAWNGLMVYWIPSGCYAMWASVNTYILLKTIKREEAAERGAPDGFERGVADPSPGLGDRGAPGNLQSPG